MKTKTGDLIRYGALGAVSGVLNGLFGAGGGVVVVPLLEKAGVDTRKSHATSVAIILPASIVSTCLYYSHGNLNLSLAAAYLPGGLVGAAVGALLLKRIRSRSLKLCFAAVIIAGAIRMLVS